MASTSTLPVPKRRKQVYGKLVNRSKWNVDSFFDNDDELPSSDALPTTTQRHATEDARHVEKKTTLSTAAPKPARPRPARHDTFDIPSSDEDELNSPAKHVSPPKFNKKMNLVDDTDSSVAQLAPWEKNKAKQERDKTPKKARSISTAASPEAQLKQDLMRSLSSPEALKSDTSSPKDKSLSIKGRITTKSQNAEPEQSSAMARLAARRNDGSLPPSKRHAIADVVTQDSPRKRARTSSLPREGKSISPLRNSTEDPTFLMTISNESDGAMDVYDIPGSSEDDRPRRKLKQSSPKPAPKRSGKRGQLTTYTSRKAVQKGASAPSRLTEMLTDADSTEAPTRSPSAPSRRSTPQDHPSTPPRAASESPDAAAKAPGTMTPKQVQLWHELLPSDSVAPSPSVLPLKDLTISGKRRSGVSQFDHKLAKSYSDVPRRRTRLVDRLKASAPKPDDSSIVEDEDEDEEEGDDDVEMVEDASNTTTSASLSERPALPNRMSSQMSQTQRQVAAITQNGPKITYAQSRSYLQEDNLEHNLMASLATDTSQNMTQTKRNGKAVSASQNSSFDLEDSEDDNAGGGKIRTIHELRAAGRNVSGMYDIEELLGEIQNHNASHRGRRRSALIELATKLADKTFAVRFTAQSFEIEIATECGATPDSVGDFVLVSALALILVSEPSQHTLRSCKDHDIVTWLAGLLDQDVEVSKMAKSRSNNMSKAALASLVEFSEMLKTQSSLWPNGSPTTMTTRLIAQKALDQLVSKLRRSGDRSELLEHDQIAGIIPPKLELSNSEKQIDLDLAISILESLSTSTASLSWPSSTLHSLADLFPRLDPTSTAQRHTVFLMLRLCLNLTNDNIPNCHLLSTSPIIVRCLLHSIVQAFARLDTIELTDEQERALALDILVLSMGILINLAEHSDTARQHAIQSTEALPELISIFQHGQKHMEEAESVEESVTNVAFGYLAVVLANLCRNVDARRFVAERLPGKNLAMLVDAVEEFVSHHSKVDMMNFEGEEGAEVWSAFTEKLRVVLVRLKEVEG